MPYMFQTFLSFRYEKNWRFLFYCRKNFVICSKFRAVSLFLSTARIRFYLIRAVEIFLSSSWHFQKKCRAVEIRAVAFRAVDPDSLILLTTLLAFSQAVKLTAKPDGLYYNGKKVFLSGVNIAWDSYGNDFGNNRVTFELWNSINGKE